ncbi:hypothetical protein YASMINEVIRUS_1011 [Yasminevirus sp. GU-2018]|uniref:Uncharacterized protein n=1 Tax=Yasminevirus sp. GU-2018 TaxID=2420051 RepID=A0A5K0U968_9VIRU|nr:hypothetical protein YASMINEVIRUS_1011 [Yasminevirus sp. GU-2018]
MSRQAQSFKKTGKNVTVSRDDLINATTERLAQFDSLPAEQKMKASNPYQDPVLVKTSEGKMVQVPRYIQNVAIVRWRSDKLSSHTRMDRRKRYAGRDPYIMNRDLKDVEGDRDDFDNYDSGKVDRELAVHRAGDAQRRKNVGQARVPDPRFGKGGSYGDLPRDFEIFNRRVDRGVDDTSYVDDRNTASRVNPDGFYEDSDPNAFESHRDYETRVRSRANRRAPSPGRRQMGGPASHARDGRDVRDAQVLGVEGDSSAESSPEGNAVVENYAPLNDDEPMEDDERVDNYDPYATECTSCNMGDNRPIYRGQRPTPTADEEEEYEYDDDYEDEDYDDNEDDPVSEGMIEGMDAGKDKEDCDNTYKYLFFVLLLIVAVLFYNYKKNNGSGFGF